MATGKLTKSNSSAVAQILLFKKPDSSFHLCVDYRALNKVTVQNKYLLLLMTKLRDRLNTGKVFKKLDLQNRYHLVHMVEENETKIAFHNRFGLYYWRVMPFGLCNARATFQSMMDNNFHDLLDNRVIVYLDLLIHTKNVDKHVPLVREVLSRLHKANLGVNLIKSVFHIKQFEFLGYIISELGKEIYEKQIEEDGNWAVS